MRVAVLGANGQLGTDVCEQYRAAGHAVTSLTHADVDLRNAEGLARALALAEPDVVVNTAAMHNVDACEADPAAAFAVNADGALALANASRRLGFALVHISTDYVFDGKKGAAYVETDGTAPLNVYGKTKLKGEELIRTTTPTHFVVRTSALYGRAPCRAKKTGNFPQMMLKLAREHGEVRVVGDERISPTCTRDLARQIVALSDTRDFGVYHATSQGETSWYDYAAAIFELTHTTVRLDRATSAEFPNKTPRPKYSVLENAALRSKGIDCMPHWRESLEGYLATLA